MNYEIKAITQVTDGLILRINDLMQQLLNNNYPAKITAKKLKKVTQQKNAWLFGAFCNDQLVGTTTLYIVETVVRNLAVIEEVVVDKKFRSKGVGYALMCAVIEKAKKMKTDCIELNVHDKIAKKLYFKCGFEDRCTNSFRLWINTKLRF